MQVNWKQILYQYFMVTLGCIIMGIALNVFYMPNKMLSGGIGGDVLVNLGEVYGLSARCIGNRSLVKLALHHI